MHVTRNRTQLSAAHAATIAGIVFIVGLTTACGELPDAQQRHRAKDARQSPSRLTQTDDDRADNDSSHEAAKRRYVSRKFSLRTQRDVEALIQALPDLSKSDVTALYIEDVKIKAIPDDLLKSLCSNGQDLIDLSIRGCGVSPPEAYTPPVISDAGMEYISGLPNLKALGLGCSLTPKGLECLAGMSKLESLDLGYQTITAKEYFDTVSKICSIRALAVVHADFSQPIDDDTFKAITSLNGRLESLNFGEWGETTIHPSMIPAIAEIESLTWLELGSFVATYEDLNPIRKKLVYLSHFGPTTKETAGVRTTVEYQSRERCPIQFRPVDSPTSMLVLLEYVLGRSEAAGVRREVVRRRAGLSATTEDFTTSKLPLTDILQKSFGVKDTRRALALLHLIASEYPELDEQIRRYLSGKDLTPATASPPGSESMPSKNE